VAAIKPKTSQIFEAVNDKDLLFLANIYM
jgi:hypothetical protein